MKPPASSDSLYESVEPFNLGDPQASLLAQASKTPPQVPQGPFTKIAVQSTTRTLGASPDGLKGLVPTRRATLAAHGITVHHSLCSCVYTCLSCCVYTCLRHSPSRQQIVLRLLMPPVLARYLIVVTKAWHIYGHSVGFNASHRWGHAQASGNRPKGASALFSARQPGISADSTLCRTWSHSHTHTAPSS